MSINIAAPLITVPMNTISPSISESALAVLTQRGLIAVLEAAGVDVTGLVREIGNNAAMCVVCNEIQTDEE